MSKIEKLAVQGVRNFGPITREAITFNTPLTLIVGYNGSGKTTIIECLKYATTGELPPNSKGGAFIHDPKLCGEKEVRAQVKLSFRSSAGERHVVTRNLQLTVKKTQRTQKTLEGSLVCSTNGERNTMSSKVGDLDTRVPEILGVSTAVLDFVIFCHQDESLWPMSEPSALKKKFDEIFEALRYTKAIDNLKVLRKKQGEDLQKLKQAEDYEKTNKEKGERAEKRSMALQAEIEAFREKCNVMAAEIEEIEANKRTKQEQANSFLGIVNELNNKREQLEYRQDIVQELRNSIEVLDEPDEWLEDALAQYEEKLASVQAEAQDNQAQYLEMQKQVAASRKSLSTKLAEQGKHQSEKEKYERQLQSRVGMIRGAAGHHGIRGYDGDIDDSQVGAFIERINRSLTDKKRDLDRLQRENSREYDTAMKAITDLEGRKAASTQNRVSAKQRIGAIDKRMNVVQNDLSLLKFDEGAKAVLDTTSKDLDDQLEAANQELNESGLDGQIQQESNRLYQLEAEGEQLNRELMEYTRLSSERAQLDLRRKELSDRKRKLDTLSNTWKDKLTGMIGHLWDAESIEADFEEVQKGQNTRVAEIRKENDNTLQELKHVDFKLGSARERCRKTQSERDKNLEAVTSALKEADENAIIEEFGEVLEENEAVVRRLEQDIGMYDVLKEFYQDAQRNLEKHDKCRLCERSFEGQEELRTKFSKKVAERLTDRKKKQLMKEKDELMPKLEGLRQVRSRFEAYERFSAEVPSLTDEIKSLESQKEAIVRRQEDQDAIVKNAEEQRQDFESMNRTVADIGQLARDIKDSEKQIERLASQQQSGGASRSPDEINEMQSSCSEQMRSAKNKITKLTAEKQRMKDNVSSLELERSELRNKIATAVQQLDRKKDFLGQIQALKDEAANQRDIIQNADKELEAMEPEIAKSRSIRDDTLRRGRAKEQTVAEERDALAKSVSELKMISDEIDSYLERGGESNLATNQRAISNLEQAISDTEKDMQELTRLTNNLREDIANSDKKKKNIGDNINYRKNLRLLDGLKRSIVDLESRNAQEDYERLYKEAQSYQNHATRLHAEQQSMTGTMRAKDDELARLLDEWEQDYKDAARIYRETHIKVETTKAAIEDLGRYGSALDKAIMQYHSLKMEEINRIAGELWQSTYQGTDIDTIAIRSDGETAAGRRSYNYRVVMVKQDTEMDMRGRCSAGQKVLASIIIRLALAESFGINCGLIALDEPTTNLDSDNIRALAMSLHGIIKARQAQANFQLIVITHDEEFLKHMQCSEFCDTFFRVKRNEKQNSVIVRESITKVME